MDGVVFRERGFRVVVVGDRGVVVGDVVVGWH